MNTITHIFWGFLKPSVLSVMPSIGPAPQVHSTSLPRALCPALGGGGRGRAYLPCAQGASLLAAAGKPGGGSEEEGAAGQEK